MRRCPGRPLSLATARTASPFSPPAAVGRRLDFRREASTGDPEVHMLETVAAEAVLPKDKHRPATVRAVLARFAEIVKVGDFSFAPQMEPV